MPERERLLELGWWESTSLRILFFKNDNRQWVKNLYKAILRRESDFGGREFLGEEFE